METSKPLGSQLVRTEFTSENDDYLDIPTSNTNAEEPTSHIRNDSSPTTSSKSTPSVDPLPRYPRRARHPPERFEGTLEECGISITIHGPATVD